MRSAVAEYLGYLRVECGLAHTTCRAYAADLERFVRYLESAAAFGRGGVRPEQVESDHVRAFLWLEERRGLASRSRERALAAIGGLFRFLRAEGRLARDPVERVSAPRRSRSLPRVLSAQAVERLLEAPWPQGPLGLRNRALLEMLYATGGRVSEVCGLDLARLQLDLGYVRVRGKGNRERVVPVGRAALAALEEYVAEGRPRLLRPARAGEPALFLSRGGRRLDRHAAWRVVTARARALGIRPVPSPHTLRHSFATHLLSGGAGIREVQELLGHADVATTEIYTHVDGQRLRAVHRRFHPRA
ncbi:MAG: tyrosine recombinase XerD [Planctomycetota bacterium]|nr:MAG: tyrosine recombinase XerD [Planctomycetota bacterium]